MVALVAATTELGPALNSGRDRRSLNSAPAPVRFLTHTHAITDFDGDRLPDEAELISNGFHKNVHLTLSSPWVQVLSFSPASQQHGRLRAPHTNHNTCNHLRSI